MPSGTEPAPGSAASRLSLLKFSYHEVLDATKHQDDKVGRLLGAVAFLTAGALIFANKDVLQVDVLIADRSYRLAAVGLGAFLLIDLVAVVLFIIAMSAPLTLPYRSESCRKSHIYFRSISGLTEDEWEKQWTDDHLQDLEGELLGEIRNLAKRADRKYSRTRIATNLICAAVAVLAPTVVLGLAAAGGTTPLRWNTPLRCYVAISLATVSVALLVPLTFTTQEGRSGGRRRSRRCLVVTIPATLAAMVVTHPSGSFWAGGAWAILGLGAATVALALLGEQTLHAGVVGLVTAGGLVAWSTERPDLQLFFAVGGAILIVLPNMIRELSPRQATTGM